MSELQSPQDFILQRADIFLAGLSNPIDISTLIFSFNYYESIVSPTVAATMVIADSAGLLSGNRELNRPPLQGTERVELLIKHSFSDEPVVYVFRVWKIGNRVSSNKTQVYTLGLISEEGLVNEASAISRTLSGKTEDIISGPVLKEALKSEKSFIKGENYEPSLFQNKITTSRTRPFDVVSKLVTKTVRQTSNGTGTSQNSMATSSEKIEGSAGYFFWESNRGYNFFSVDYLCDNKNESVRTWGPFIEQHANLDDFDDTRDRIIEASFSSDVDLMKSLRTGKYSTLAVFFNHSTGQYEEYVYSLKESYDKMKHLGGQEKMEGLRVTQEQLSDYPTRVMSVYLDHESFYNKSDIASPNDTDGSKNPSPFADWHKTYAVQSLTRYSMMQNQTGVIVIVGNPLICAGDRIDIRIRSKLSDKETERQPYDTETSGVYLIQEVNHKYETTTGANGQITTTLTVMRDTFGMKDEGSLRDDS